MNRNLSKVERIVPAWLGAGAKKINPENFRLWHIDSPPLGYCIGFPMASLGD